MLMEVSKGYWREAVPTPGVELFTTGLSTGGFLDVLGAELSPVGAEPFPVATPTTGSGVAGV